MEAEPNPLNTPDELFQKLLEEQGNNPRAIARQLAQYVNLQQLTPEMGLNYAIGFSTNFEDREGFLSFYSRLFIDQQG